MRCKYCHKENNKEYCPRCNPRKNDKKKINFWVMLAFVFAFQGLGAYIGTWFAPKSEMLSFMLFGNICLILTMSLLIYNHLEGDV